jgi:hypothetical protein
VWQVSDQVVIVSGGTSFSSLLGILFIWLKLAGFITWPWLWVLAPLWIPAALILIIVLVVFLYALTSSLID